MPMMIVRTSTPVDKLFSMLVELVESGIGKGMEAEIGELNVDIHAISTFVLKNSGRLFIIGR